MDRQGQMKMFPLKKVVGAKLKQSIQQTNIHTNYTTTASIHSSKTYINTKTVNGIKILKH